MAIFWGMGSKSKNYEGLWVPYFCSICDSFSAFAVTENYRYGQVYGIRIAKYKAKHFLVCQKCDRAISLDTPAQFATAQAIGRRIATNSPETFNVMAYVAEVARFVFNNKELADLIEENEREKLSSASQSIEGNADFPEESASEFTESSNMKICPDCAESVKFAARKCRFCNYQFE